MQIIKLYKYIREDGGVTVSPNKPNGEYTEMYRLAADEGKELTNGEVVTTCTDVETVEGWEEVLLNEEEKIRDQSESHINPAYGGDY